MTMFLIKSFFYDWIGNDKRSEFIIVNNDTPYPPNNHFSHSTCIIYYKINLKKTCFILILPPTIRSQIYYKRMHQYNFKSTVYIQW